MEQERLPEAQYQIALRQPGDDIDMEYPTNIQVFCLPFMIWELFPHHREKFTPDRPEGLGAVPYYACPPPREFLSEGEKEKLYPYWLRVFKDGSTDVIALLREKKDGED